MCKTSKECDLKTAYDSNKTNHIRFLPEASLICVDEKSLFPVCKLRDRREGDIHTRLFYIKIDRVLCIFFGHKYP